LPTLLALAASHVNDSNRAETYSTIKAWVDRNKKYEATVRAYLLQAGPEPELMANRFDHLIQCLIAMARSDTTGAVDADVQIALAVTLNANEVSRDRS
jgi:peroxin-5